MTVQEQIWQFFSNAGFSPKVIAGIMGNIDKESNFLSNNVEDRAPYSDEQYTSMVDNGYYSNFANDGYGYGLVQWTYPSLKEDLFNYCKQRMKSISDVQCQLEQLYLHLQSEGVFNQLQNAFSVEESTRIFMLKFEKPADQSEEAQQDRIKRAKKWYNSFNNKNTININPKKYNSMNPPLVCMMTNSTCYQQTSKMNVKGVLWHSTGANNPTLKRYVQPSENDPNYAQLITKIGRNTNNNDWNHIYMQAGLNAWIGKLADGTVATIQTMPWDYKPWGCGSGSNGSCNDGWIQFEICEDQLNDINYFNQVYQEACNLTAYLCKLYNINPAGTVNYNGVTVPTILCHRDSAALGLGTWHEDIYHWFGNFGKNMTDARRDVYTLVQNSIESPIKEDNTIASSMLKKGMKDNDQVRLLQKALLKLNYNLGIDGADGNFGPITEQAVMLFQQQHGLSPNGIFGVETFLKMKEALTKAEQGSPVDQLINSGLPKSQAPQYNDVMLGSSSKDENGQYSGGQGGDQTDKEVYILNWYSNGWTSVLRPNNSNLAEKIASAAEAGCLNNYIGYSQSTRNTLLAEAKQVGMDLSKITSPCNCDCSSFVSTCCVCAGLPESIMFPYGNGCTTWTIAEQCLKTGQFIELTDSKYLNQKNYLKRGDILLNRNSHVVIVLSNGSMVVPEVQYQQTSNNFPYLVRITANMVNVRYTPSYSAPITAQVKRNDVYTIMAEENGYGKLKSGLGWIKLEFTEKIS